MLTFSTKSRVPELAKYGLSRERGFLPPQDPLTRLPPAYHAWDTAIQEVPRYIDACVIRQQLDKLPLLPSSGLKDGPELQRAYSVLSLMCHAYIWGEGEDRACEVLPSNLAVPWVEVSKRLGLPPIITHAASVLWSWRRIDPEGPLDLSNMECLNITGPDEAWFYLVTVEIEAKGATALCAMVDGLVAAEEDRPDDVVGHLDELARAIGNMGATLKRMYEKCDPQVFFNKVRLYQSGWKNNPARPNGLIYEGVSKDPLQYSGGSAAQSSSIHAIDVGLGVEHGPVPKSDESNGVKGTAAECSATVKAESNGNGVACPVTGQQSMGGSNGITGCPVKTAGHEDTFLRAMRQHMPEKDRAFLEALESVPSIRSYVCSHQDTCPALRVAYNAALDALIAFRSIHIQIVTVYVVSQAARAKTGTEPADQPRGTAGTSVMPFLKHVREESKIKKITQ